MTYVSGKAPEADRNESEVIQAYDKKDKVK